MAEIEISEERINVDATELFIYGVSATHLFVDFRDVIDCKVKQLMVEVAKFYDQYLGPDKGNKIVLKQYRAFWVMFEPHIQQFYEELKEILAPPPGFITHDILPEDAFCYSEIDRIEQEVEDKMGIFMKELLFLHELKHRQEILNKICKPIKDKLDQALKIQNADIRKMENLEKPNQKRIEMVESLMENVDKKTLMKFIASDVERNDDQEILERFLTRRREENKSVKA